jgi:hypothetical protein
MVKNITLKLYVLFSHRYWGDKHEDDEIGRKCSTHRVEYVHKFLVSHAAYTWRWVTGVIAICGNLHTHSYNTFTRISISTRLVEMVVSDRSYRRWEAERTGISGALAMIPKFCPSVGCEARTGAYKEARTETRAVILDTVCMLYPVAALWIGRKKETT